MDWNTDEALPSIEPGAPKVVPMESEPFIGLGGGLQAKDKPKTPIIVTCTINALRTYAMVGSASDREPNPFRK